MAVSSNWFNTGTTAADAFYQADDVRFNDTAGVMTIIDILDAVAPATVTIDATNNAYTFNGPGRISGGANLLKKGDSTLVVNSTNDFTGTVTLERGILQLGNNSSLGSTAGGTVISDGATLDIGITDYAANTVNIGVEPLTVSGAGYAGQGAIVNNSANAQQNAVRMVTLAGNASFGGNGRWDIRGTGATLSTGGNPYKMTKVGANQLSIVGANVDPTLGDIEIQAGTLSFETGTTSAGDPTKLLTVQPGGTLQVYQLLVALDKRIILNGDGASFYNNNGVNTVAGPITLNGNCVFNVGGTSLTLLNTLSGAGGLTKIGNNVLSLSAVSTYSGDTVVNAGTLALTGTGSISGSSNITLAAATTLLDVSARTDGKLTLPGGRTLTGNGTIRGSLQVNAGGTLSPGNPSLGAAVDALTVTDVVTLGGTNIMEIDKSNLTNDVIRGAAAIQYGGTLNVTEISSIPFVDGDSFKLFDATSYSGAFTSITPATPAAGLFWDTSELTSSGTLKVVATAPPPSITSVVKSGNNIVFSGSGGIPSDPYYVLVSTDIALPVSNWTPIVTNSFGAGGEFSFTEAVNPDVPRRFYLLQVP